ncbi:MAG: polyhydroxyalkanoate synthesis repressor PhaR [Rhodocyclaceae bacterium]|nr:polyhydroxyalkanoate synthesis repressor PhaR [Rhodocyclaceae bacterium]
MAESRLIKKYPNRRLYDTKTSSYITLVDVKELVVGHEDFQVVDAKTGDDLTRSILLQIILEEETAGMPLFTSDLLTHMIRFYGNAMQGMLGKYLESNIHAFSDMQAKLTDQARTLYGENTPVNKDLWAQFLNFQGPAMQSMLSSYVDQSQKMFMQMQEQIEGQTRNLFAGFPFPAIPGIPGLAGQESEVKTKAAAKK